LVEGEVYYLSLVLLIRLVAELILVTGGFSSPIFIEVTSWELVAIEGFFLIAIFKVGTGESIMPLSSEVLKY